jgi:3-dehydroquinate dehydratase-2
LVWTLSSCYKKLTATGTREPHIYGSTTLSDVTQAAESQCSSRGVQFSHFQSNWEGAIIDRIHEARGKVDAIIVNPAALTHTSVALRDALTGIDIPFIEVHITNVHKREPFRHHSYLSDKAEAVICGLGVFGYTAAIDYAMNKIKRKDDKNSQTAIYGT